MVIILRWSYKWGGRKVGFHCRYFESFQWCSTEVKEGGMTKHQKALTLVAHSSSVTHLTEVVCCLLLVKKNAHDNNLISSLS